MIRNLLFQNRAEAGKALGRALVDMKLADPVVLALPRGGVPVGYEVAKALGAPLDVILVRKIGAPGHKEYGIGAVVDGSAMQTVINEAAARMVGADRAYIEREVARELGVIERRREAYRSGPPVPVKGRTVVVIDDGIATGSTAMVALQALAKAGPSRIILAVPVAPRDSLNSLRGLCDDVVCLLMPEPFHAVGAHYRDFGQTSDDEVIRLLEDARLDIEDHADRMG
ncbi:phosphoribosyltransferase [Qipengyuania psychrotolerans]|uniref:Phosphoribosyltransferase n=1 Tax=Qipengyuania psychrotolerans TaxID=2867238 RepID=A0ABX8ZD38_9SPHN|nr:phosphoribosyltransferase [Qipengyuania psychrotolerans]QZD86885.1 phosphoribosyltransferase [Qipengyuania psychrotolerans]